MSLKGILSISGTGGLFKVVAQTKNGFIVESLADKKRIAVSSTQKISMLDDISVYCESGDKPLREVFKAMQENDSDAEDAQKSAQASKDFITKALPDWDRERVYASDIAKMIKWYLLLRNNVTFDAEEEKTESVNEQPAADTEAGETSPA